MQWRRRRPIEIERMRKAEKKDKERHIILILCCWRIEHNEVIQHRCCADSVFYNQDTTPDDLNKR